MTGSTQEYADYILELLSPVKTVSSGRFFGGIGLKSEGTQFAMIMDNSLFLVVDDTSRNKYLEYGTECFWYKTKKKKVNVKKYHEVPVEIIENNEAIIEWALEAVSVANKLKK